MRLAMLALLLAGAAAPGRGQVPTAPPAVAAADGARYRFDLARNFFATPEAELADRANVIAAAEAVEALAARADSPGMLLQALEAEDRMQRLFRRHDLYLFLRFAIDVRREQEIAASDALRARVRAARLALRRAVLALTPDALDRAFAARPALARYRFWIATIRREAPHMLSPEQQSVVATLEPLLGAADYPRIVNALQFADLQVGERTLNAGRDRGEIAANPSEEVRRQGSRLLFAGYAAKRDLLAAMLVRAIQGSNALARVRGHASEIDEAAFDAYLTPAHIDGVLAAVAARTDFYKAWQRRNRYALTTPRRWTADEAVEAVVVSAGALGPEYRREFAELLDPANGRADLGPGENRYPTTGTASVYPTGESAIFMGGFTGSLLDLIVLGHEGGHAVQAQLLHRHGVRMAYAAGPGYFTESFGRFQELLLLDSLHRAARTPAERRALRDAFASRLMSIFPSAEEAAVELDLHRAVNEGSARDADQLDAVAAEAGARFSFDYERAPERRGIWMLSDGYFLAPMQEINDLYSALLAIRYFQLHRRDPAAFRRGYMALLSGGYDAEPADLLRRNLGIDFTARDFTRETLAILQVEVERLYR